MLLFEKLKEQNCSVFCLEITTVLTSIHKAFNKGSLTEKMGPFSQQDVKILRLRRSMPPTENGRWRALLIAMRR
jgi:hypothetical protein